MDQVESVWKPRVVSAGVPMRIPLGDNDDLSPATVFLFTEMETSSNTFSILDPVRPCGRKSHSRRWLSVPAVSNLNLDFGRQKQWTMSPFQSSIHPSIHVLVHENLEDNPYQSFEDWSYNRSVIHRHRCIYSAVKYL